MRIFAGATETAMLNTEVESSRQYEDKVAIMRPQFQEKIKGNPVSELGHGNRLP